MHKSFMGVHKSKRDERWSCNIILKNVITNFKKYNYRSSSIIAIVSKTNCIQIRHYFDLLQEPKLGNKNPNQTSFNTDCLYNKNKCIITN
jgi:hypothetical protein